MVDAFAILSTTLCILYILLRAVAFDRSLPWFEADESPASEDRNSHGSGLTSRNSRRF